MKVYHWTLLSIFGGLHFFRPAGENSLSSMSYVVSTICHANTQKLRIFTQAVPIHVPKLAGQPSRGMAGARHGPPASLRRSWQCRRGGLRM
jgi:hypothetical protein